MARTLDPAAHSLRRDAFVDAAQQLIQTRGYDQLSLQDIIDELGASKGALYHYFGSKEALLEAVIRRMTDGAWAVMAPIADDPTLSATQKFERLFSTLADFKGQRREFLIELLRVWMSDDNSIVREHFRRETGARITPLFVAIVGQGIAEGTFSASSADGTAAVLVALILGANETATQLFLARHANLITVEDVVARLGAFSEAFERILGLPAGSSTLLDEATLHLWYD